MRSNFIQLPNLFIIGASKCGTTSLYHLLEKHDECCMSLVKEPHYFNSSGKTKDWYLNLFAACQGSTVIGEASPIYSETTYFPSVPGKIYEFNPSAKIVYMVRHPYERLKSVWKQTLSTGHFYEKKYYHQKMPLNFRKAIFYYPPFLEASKYWTHIQNYRKYFPDENIKIIFFDDFVSNSKNVMQDLACFLGLHPFNDVKLDAEQKNSSTGKTVASPFYYFLKNFPIINALSKKFIPEGAKKFVSNKLTLPVPSDPHLNDDTKAEIRNRLESEIQALFSYTDKPSNYWKL